MSIFPSKLMLIHFFEEVEHLLEVEVGLCSEV